MSNISIVRINKENYSLFYKLHVWRKSGCEVIDYLAPTCPNSLQINNYYLFVATIKDKPAGYVSASIIPKPDNRKGTLFIDDVWVAPKFRKRGIATELINTIKEVGKDAGLWRVRLVVNTDNKSAISVYNSSNFKISSECFFMELKLYE